MKEKIENTWTKTICEMLKKEIDNTKYEITCLEEVPYQVSLTGSINSYEQTKPMSYQTDLLIKEKNGDSFIPRIIIESKYKEITTHDAIVYSQKAESHKELFIGLRYGIMICNIKKVPLRLLRHGRNFDFMMTFSNDIPTEQEWNLFVDIIKRNLAISSQYGTIVNDKWKRKNKNFKCMENNTIFHIF